MDPLDLPLASQRVGEAVEAIADNAILLTPAAARVSAN
jgi:hypothetical protein